MHQRGYLAATDVNLSVRIDPETVLSTPTGMSKGMLEPEDLVVVDMKGKRVTGRRQVSSEIGMHLLIYSLRPDTHGMLSGPDTAPWPTGVDIGRLVMHEGAEADYIAHAPYTPVLMAGKLMVRSSRSSAISRHLR